MKRSQIRFFLSHRVSLGRHRVADAPCQSPQTTRTIHLANSQLSQRRMMMSVVAAAAAVQPFPPQPPLSPSQPDSIQTRKPLPPRLGLGPRWRGRRCGGSGWCCWRRGWSWGHRHAGQGAGRGSPTRRGQGSQTWSGEFVSRLKVSPLALNLKRAQRILARCWLKILRILNPYLWLRSADGSRLDRSRLVEPGENLWDASVGDKELSGDVTGPHTHHGQLHNPPSHVVRKRSAVDEHPAQLVDTCLTWRIVSLEYGKALIHTIQYSTTAFRLKLGEFLMWLKRLDICLPWKQNFGNSSPKCSYEINDAIAN